MSDYADWMQEPDGTLSHTDQRRRQKPCETSHLEDGRLCIRASEIQPERYEWLWYGRLAKGKITVLDGDPDVGKSTITCDVAAALTTRSELPGVDQRLESACGVIFANAEDSASDTIRPRLEAAGADLDLCLIVSPGTEKFFLAEGLQKLECDVADVQAKLVVIDPLMAFLREKTNSWKDQDMRSVLAPVTASAEKMGVAILLIRHPNKSGDTRAMYRGGGSIGIIGAARFGLFAAQHPTDPDLRVLASSDCNLARKPSALAYQIVESKSNPEIGVVEWQGTVDLTADELVAYGVSTKDREIDVAVAFLIGLLASGPVPSEEVIDNARAARISKRTLQRAKEKLGVRSRKQGTQWYWELPTEPHYFTNGVATDVPF